MAKSKEDRKKDSEVASKQAKGKKGKEAKDTNFKEEKVPVRLLEFYRTKIVPDLMKKHGYKNVLNYSAGMAEWKKLGHETTTD